LTKVDVAVRCSDEFAAQTPPELSQQVGVRSKLAGQDDHSVYIKNWIEPTWYGQLACSMKTMQIQEWLDKIQRPDGTKLKIKNVLSAIFSHGVRWELVERNPVCGQGGSPGHRGASTGVRQRNRISIARVVLPPDVVRQTLEQLPLREATMALVDAVTALRASELIALKWNNVGWKSGILQSEFALVEGELKETKSRSNPLPLAQPVLEVLRLWREHTPYRLDEDWIFASPHYQGKTP
jgi:integrase